MALVRDRFKNVSLIFLEVKLLLIPFTEDPRREKRIILRLLKMQFILELLSLTSYILMLAQN